MPQADLRSEDRLRRQFEQLNALGPLCVGALVTVRGDEPYDIGVIAGEVSELRSK